MHPPHAPALPPARVAWHFRRFESLGAHPDGGGTRFAVWVPNARRVPLIGGFNGWRPQALQPLGRRQRLLEPVRAPGPARRPVQVPRGRRPEPDRGQGRPLRQDWRRLLRPLPAPELKQLVTWRLLQLRRHWPELFREAAYVSISVQGPAEEHALACARVQGGRAVAVVCTRLAARLAARGGWQDTRLALPGGHSLVDQAQRWQEWLTGRVFETCLDGLPLAGLLPGGPHDGAALPLAVLVCEGNDG